MNNIKISTAILLALFTSHSRAEERPQIFNGISALLEELQEKAQNLEIAYTREKKRVDAHVEKFKDGVSKIDTAEIEETAQELFNRVQSELSQTKNRYDEFTRQVNNNHSEFKKFISEAEELLKSLNDSEDAQDIKENLETLKWNFKVGLEDLIRKYKEKTDSEL